MSLHTGFCKEHKNHGKMRLSKKFGITVLRGLFRFNGQAPTSLDEIKTWLKDPANAVQLNTIGRCYGQNQLIS
jgi:hypothetical protein